MIPLYKKVLADISLIEWGVYGFIAYSSLLMLIISTVKDVPNKQALSIIRAIYLIPGMISAGVLASTGPNITMPNITTNSTTIAVNSSEVFTEVVSQAQSFAISGNVWTLVHIMIFIVLFVYVVSQILVFMTKTE